MKLKVLGNFPSIVPAVWSNLDGLLPTLMQRSMRKQSSTGSATTRASCTNPSSSGWRTRSKSIWSCPRKTGRNTSTRGSRPASRSTTSTTASTCSRRRSTRRSSGGPRRSTRTAMTCRVRVWCVDPGVYIFCQYYIVNVMSLLFEAAHQASG